MSVIVPVLANIDYRTFRFSFPLFIVHNGNTLFASKSLSNDEAVQDHCTDMIG